MFGVFLANSGLVLIRVNTCSLWGVGLEPGRAHNSTTLFSDILFPYRSPSPRPHPDPTQHPKRTRNRPETEPNGPETDRNGAEMDRNQALWGGTAGGFVGMGGGWGL